MPKEDATAARSNPLPLPTSEIPWQLNVLVVDDDSVDMWLTLNALRADPRVRRVVSADSPIDVLAQLARGDVRPDLILLDIKMPKLDGFQFMDALKNIPAAAHTPVVMLTTSRYGRDVESARKKNVRGYLIKPDKEEELRQRLNDVITSAMVEWRRQWQAYRP